MDANGMVYCPYNKAHKMLRKKLQQHLIKCRELHKNEIELLECPFNKTHLVSEQEYFQHTKSCIDRKIIAHYQYSEPAELNNETKHEKIEAEENWDNDDVPDYNPQHYVSTAKIIRQPEGLFPSQRKAFIKKEERKRLLGEQHEDDNDAADKTYSISKKDKSPTKANAHRATPYILRNRRKF